MTKKLLTVILTICLMTSLFTFLASAEEETVVKHTLKVQVSGSGKYEITGGDKTLSYDHKVRSTMLKTGFADGSDFTITAKPNNGYEFLYWTNIYDRVIFTQTISFSLVADATYTAVFVKINSNQSGSSHQVVFLDFSNRVIKSTPVSNGTAASGPTGLKSVSEMTRSEWSCSFGNITENIVIQPLYSGNTSYTVSVFGGKVGLACSTENGIGSVKFQKSAAFNYNSIVVLKPNTAPKGSEFLGWSLDAGKTIISYEENYMFAVGTNMNICSVYTSVPKEEKAMVAIISATSTDSSVSFLSIRNLPSDYTFVESGIIISASQDKELLLENVDNSMVLRGLTISTEGCGEYRLTKSNTSGTWYAAAYLCYKDTSGAVITVYSDIATVTAE